MTTVTVTEAKRQLSALLNRVITGEVVLITRNGRPVARLSAVKQPVRSLAAFRAQMPRLRKASAVSLREMRDEERY